MLEFLAVMSLSFIVGGIVSLGYVMWLTRK
jgi:hypothetical protein